MEIGWIAISKVCADWDGYIIIDGVAVRCPSILFHWMHLYAWVRLALVDGFLVAMSINESEALVIVVLFLIT
jgi:hypothetical protein